MKENRVPGRKLVKKTEVHPLCSRKRPLSKIVASPTYRERRLRENAPPEKKKKEESVVPKFKYLVRKKRYGDDLLKTKKRNNPNKETIVKDAQNYGMLPTSSEQNNDAAGMRTPFRAEKKEYIHPLCSRQRSLSNIVASPSYKCPQKPAEVITSLYSISQKSLTKVPEQSSKYTPKLKSKNSLKTPVQRRRYTIMPSLQNWGNKENMCNVSEIASPSYTSTTMKSCLKERRRTTFSKWKPHDDASFLREGGGQGKNVMFEKESCVMTPWKNNKMSMRERLELWLASKNKAITPAKPKFAKSPHPNRKSKSTSCLVKPNKENSDEFIEESPIKCFFSEENSAGISKELQMIIGKFEENNVNRLEIEEDLDSMITKYTTIVKFADYWICKARLASLDDDVQRVICLLEQAHTFQAQPGDKIKDEICRYLELLESHEQSVDTDSDQEKQLEEDRSRLISLYAITPGRRVHFAAAESPLDFKSSVIRFCLLESKAFKRKLNAQLQRKVITPVRRSLRVERSGIPEFLRTDNRLVGSPGEVENDIIDGEISFIPNKTIDTPLNQGWLIQDETKTDHVEKNEQTDYVEENEQTDHVEENEQTDQLEDETVINRPQDEVQIEEVKDVTNSNHITDVKDDSDHVHVDDTSDTSRIDLDAVELSFM